MASTFIEISGTANRHNQQLRSFVDDLQRIIDRVRELKAEYDQAAAGGAFADLATHLGIESAASAEAIYNLLGSVSVTLTTDAFIAQMLTMVG